MIVMTEARVVNKRIFPAILLFAPIASAIIKLAIAVGHAKRIKIIPRSFPLNPKRNAE